MPGTASTISDSTLRLIHMYLLTLDALLLKDGSLDINEIGGPLITLSERVAIVYGHTPLYVNHQLYIPTTEIEV